MPILIALVMAPTLSFYFYVLVQFWKEAGRRRNHLTSAGIVPLPSAGVRRAELELERAIARATGADHVTVAASAPRLAAELARAERSERAKVVATYLKNRLAVIPSGTGRLAVKRSAKG
jgi:hypothetical protein